MVKTPRRFPFYAQAGRTECGLACLRTVLGGYGRHVDADELREAFGGGRDGASASVILDVAQTEGLDTGCHVRVEPAQLAVVHPGAILYWNFNHFVVFERYSAHRGARIVDPARGRRWARPDELDKRFTGVVLVLTPSAAFETKPRSGRTMRWYASLVRGHSGALRALLITSVVVQALTLAGAKTTQLLVDDVLPTRELSMVWLLALAMAIVAAVQAVVGYARGMLLLRLRTHLDVEMSTSFYAHLLSLPFGFFEQRAIGDLVNRLSSNAALRELVSSRAVAALIDGSLLLVLAAVIAYYSPTLGLLVVALGAARAAILYAYQRRRQDLLQENLAAQSRSQTIAVETLSGVFTVKAAGGEQRALKRWRQRFLESTQGSVTLGTISSLADAMGAFLTMLAPALVLALCAHETLKGRLTLGEAFGLVNLAGHFATAVISLAATWEAWQQASQHSERVLDVMSQRPEQPPGLPPAPPLNGAIEFRDVVFRYSAHSPDVLKQINLSVRGGEYVAIVGRSGSGKSTMARLMLGLYAPTSGAITYDGAPLTWDVATLRQQFGCVIQESRVFSGSIRDSITGGADFPIEQVVEAAKAAQIHDDIWRMPMRYNTLLSEAASNMSGGQRQRLAIARALASGPRIVLLDEATSALDAVLEARIYDNLARMRITRIVIAHRLSSICRADMIVVLSEGRVAECGTHHELLDQRGVYATLIAAQQPGPPQPRPGAALAVSTMG